MHPSSPQAREMADESMVRNLSAQAEAIWPQEEPVFARHPPLEGARALDVGCGTGEIVARLAARFPQASFVGVDLEESHLERARVRCAAFGPRVRFQRGDALALSFPAAELDLREIAADYVVVDTLRVERETFARIWEAWRDGYTDPLVQHTGVPRAEIERRFREMIDCARDPRGYALWQVPVWTALKR